MNLTEIRLRKADEIVRRIDTVTLLRVEEVNNIRERALAGEYDDLDPYERREIAR